jgi:hypothetical protein
MISMVDNLYLDEIKAENKTKIFFPTLGGTTAKKFSEKNKSNFFPKKNTWFCSEFNADSNHVICFQKCWGEKMALPPLVL